MRSILLIKKFINTENKKKIREIDVHYIKNEMKHHDSKLNYLGLPSEGLYDILAWNEYIEHFTAVEMGKKSNPSIKQHLLVSNAINYGLSEKMTLLRGEINEIIIAGKDHLGTELDFPYELVNLDYGGTLLYKDRNRIEALRRLVYCQDKRDFLLLLTCLNREYDKDELEETQRRIISEIISFKPEYERILIKYYSQLNSEDSLLRQIQHVHFLIKYLGEENRYDVNCYPAIHYVGSNDTELLHYIVKFRYQHGASTRIISKQTLLELVSQSAFHLGETELESIENPLEL
jgi:hypothetical protein